MRKTSRRRARIERQTERHADPSHAEGVHVEQPDTPAEDFTLHDATAPRSRASIDPRLSLRLDPDGTLAIDRISPRVLDSLKLALTDQALAKLGLARADAAAAAAAPQMDAAIAGVVYDALGMVYVALAQRAGYTADEAAIMRFTQAEKDALAPMTMVELNQLLGDAKTSNRTLLLLSVGMMTTGKFAQLRQLRAAATVTQFPDARVS